MVAQLWLDIKAVVCGVFEAFEKAPPVAWFPFENCFEAGTSRPSARPLEPKPPCEVFGVDVMVDQDWKLWLLEETPWGDDQPCPSSPPPLTLQVNSGADFETFGRCNADRCEAFLGDHCSASRPQP